MKRSGMKYDVPLWIERRWRGRFRLVPTSSYMGTPRTVCRRKRTQR